MLSIPHLIIIFVVALVVFGPQKLPELARTLGKVMAEFRRATGDLRMTFEDQMRELERESQALDKKKRELEAAEKAKLDKATADAAKPAGESIPATEAAAGGALELGVVARDAGATFAAEPPTHGSAVSENPQVATQSAGGEDPSGPPTAGVTDSTLAVPTITEPAASSTPQQDSRIPTDADHRPA
jgi:TatA/E family protein of Tat protein translocase